MSSVPTIHNIIRHSVDDCTVIVIVSRKKEEKKITSVVPCAQCSHMFLEGISGAIRLVSIEGGNSDEYRAHAANIWSKEEFAVKSNTVFAAFHRRMPCTFSAAEKKVRMKVKPTIKNFFPSKKQSPHNLEVSCLVSQ